jgi:hypothetical protein
MEREKKRGEHQTKAGRANKTLPSLPKEKKSHQQPSRKVVLQSERDEACDKLIPICL